MRWLPLVLAACLAAPLQAASLRDIRLNDTLKQVAEQSNENTPRDISAQITDLGFSAEGDELINRLAVDADYAELMQSLFDFDRMRDWIRQGHGLRFDAMHAVTGPYARRILVEQLGAPAASVLNATPLEDFGGGHPDPNLVYGKHLVELAFGAGTPELVAASDGDGDRTHAT